MSQLFWTENLLVWKWQKSISFSWHSEFLFTTTVWNSSINIVIFFCQILKESSGKNFELGKRYRTSATHKAFQSDGIMNFLSFEITDSISSITALVDSFLCVDSYFMRMMLVCWIWYFISHNFLNILLYTQTNSSLKL